MNKKEANSLKVGDIIYEASIDERMVSEAYTALHSIINAYEICSIEVESLQNSSKKYFVYKLTNVFSDFSIEGYKQVSSYHLKKFHKLDLNRVLQLKLKIDQLVKDLCKTSV